LELENLKMPCYGEVPKDITEKVDLESPAKYRFESKTSFGQALAQMDFKNRSTVKSVQPVYTRPPLITKKKGG